MTKIFNFFWNPLHHIFYGGLGHFLGCSLSSLFLESENPFSFQIFLYGWYQVFLETPNDYWHRFPANSRLPRNFDETPLRVFLKNFDCGFACFYFTCYFATENKAITKLFQSFLTFIAKPTKLKNYFFFKVIWRICEFLCGKVFFLDSPYINVIWM